MTIGDGQADSGFALMIAVPRDVPPKNVWLFWLNRRKTELQTTAKRRGQAIRASVQCLKCFLLSTIYFLFLCNFPLAPYTTGELHPHEINSQTFLYQL